MPQDFIIKNLGIIFLLLTLWLSLLSFVVWNFFESFKNLTRSAKAENLVDILKQILENSNKNSQQLKKLEDNLEKLAVDSRSHIQKVSLLRFNPFSDVGGDQSFVATFLDGQDSGIIISSLHSRVGTRVYAKPVEKGEPRQGIRLSTEEIRSLKAAVEAKNV